MKTINIVNGPINSSVISLGAFRMAKETKESAANVISAAIELGVNFFDNATCYTEGEAETRFGEAKELVGASRDKYIIQTKCGLEFQRGVFDWSEENILKAAEDSMRRMKIDYIDVLLLHRPDLIYDPEEVASAFDKLYYSGKVKYFGVSNLKPMQIEVLKKYVKQPIIINQLQLSVATCPLIEPLLYMNMDVPMSVCKDGDILDYCRLNDITIQAWSPMQHGFFGGTFLDNPDFPDLNKALHRLGDKYGVPISAIAIAWILRHPAKMQAIVGTMNPSHLKDICEATKVNLTKEEWYELFLAAGHYLP